MTGHSDLCKTFTVQGNFTHFNFSRCYDITVEDTTGFVEGATYSMDNGSTGYVLQIVAGTPGVLLVSPDSVYVTQPGVGVITSNGASTNIASIVEWPLPSKGDILTDQATGATCVTKYVGTYPYVNNDDEIAVDYNSGSDGSGGGTFPINSLITSDGNIAKMMVTTGGYFQTDGFIDFRESQDRHWTGVIYLNNPYDNDLYNIYGLDRAPDYFKIVLLEGQSQYFVQGNWSTFVNPVDAPVDTWPYDGFWIGDGYGNGGELSFWRETYSDGLYHTGNLRAYTGAADYWYD